MLVVAMVFVVTFSQSHSQAQGPENVIVAVNADSPDSLAVANHFVSLRGVPATNVVYLHGITFAENIDSESSSSKAFKSQILEPILTAMKVRGLEKQIDCITYSSGFPTRINFQPEMKKYLKQNSKKYDIHYHAPWVSINSLTYFHSNAFSSHPNFLELDANNFAGFRAVRILQNPFSGKDAEQYAIAEASLEEKQYAAAAGTLFELAKRHPQQMSVVYALARTLALKGDNEKAIQLLSYAQSRGFAYRSMVQKDKAFAALANDEKFQSVLSRTENLPETVLPTRGFSGQAYWSENGWPSGSKNQGERYLLSTVLAVTGAGQSTLEQALTQIETSVAADGTAPEGSVYFAKHGDPRSRTRQAQFKFASAELESIGRSPKTSSGKYPKNDKRVVGATLGSAVLDWKKSGSQFVPGALCDNFTSYGGWWAKASQTHLSDFLNAGAAGASGTVYEPYTIPAKIPAARLHAHYARGCTLAESYYQSVSGPFQLLIVGDPLCCPFGKFPKFNVAGLENDSVVKDDFELKIELDADSPKVRRYEVYYDGVYLSKLSNPAGFNVETEAMNDGYHEIRIVAVADTPVANRSTQRLEFVVDRAGQHVTLSAASRKIRLGQALELMVESSSDDKLEIRQNSRVIATATSGKSKSIPAAKLGRGKCQLQAVAVRGNGTLVRSVPLTIEILP